MTRFLKYGLLSLMISLTLSIPQRSEAAVSFLVKARAVKVVGAAASIGGATGITIAIATTMTASFVIASFMTFGVGMIILDEGENYLAFNRIETDLAEKLNVTEEEIKIYNSEVEEINSIYEEIAAQTELETSQEEIVSQWNDHSHYISPESFKVMQKIAMSFIK